LSAFDHPDIDSAIETRQKFALDDVELLLVMDNVPSIYDVTLPLGSRSVVTEKGRTKKAKRRPPI